MPKFSQAHDDRRWEEVTRQPLRIKRVYQVPETEDGVRILVDRLWPHGLPRERARIDLWLRKSRRATRCAAVSTATRRVGKTSRPLTTPSSNSRRRSRPCASCSIGGATRLSPCYSPLGARGATTASL